MFERLETRRLLAADYPVLATQTHVAEVSSVSGDTVSYVFANVNDDATLDLVTSTKDSLHVHIGNGDGAFDDPVSVESTDIVQLVAANIDSDSRDELLLVRSQDIAVVHLTPQGTVEKTSTLEGRSLGVEATDINGDGINDLVSAGLSSFQIAVGEGNGEFASWISYPLPRANPFVVEESKVLLHDVNQDSHVDVVATSGNSASTYLNLGDGIFEFSSTLSLPDRTFIHDLADMNRDGILDLVGASDLRKIVSWAGNTDGSFGEMLQSHDTNGRIVHLNAGDFNNDGLADLVVSHTSIFHESAAPGVSIHFGEAAGGVARPELAARTTPVEMRLTDTDQDGQLELTRLHDRFVYTQDFQVPAIFDTEIRDLSQFDPRRLFRMDVDQDGSEERIIYDAENAKLEVFSADNVVPIQTIDFALTPTDFRSTDMNGDGRPDLIVFARPDRQVQISTLFVDAEGQFAAPVSTTQAISQSYLNPTLVDLNDDQIPDAFGLGGRQYVIQYGRRDGSFSEAQIVDTSVFAVSGVRFVDLNNDGFPEIAQDAFTTTLLSRQADGTYAPLDLSIKGLFAFGDFDGDGNIDIAAASAGVLSIAPGNGTFQFTLSPLGSATSILSTDDINGDETDDLITITGNTVSVYHGSNSGLSFHTSFDGWNSASNAIVQDFTGDGIDDFLTFNDKAGNLIVIGSPGPSYALATLGIGGADGQVTDVVRYSVPGFMFKTVQAEDQNDDGKLDIHFESFTGMFGTIANISTPPDGDLNQDGEINASDIDFLCSQFGSTTNERADLNNDQQVDRDDLDYLVEEIMNTALGDINLDGEVGFADFLVLSANFGKSLGSWSQGDLDCSGDVGFGDFLVLSANFGFKRDA